MAELTPMMRQYHEIKEHNSDCILFFRLGDFYEMFDEDARVASRELDLTLTTRDRGKDKEEPRTPMCGVPYHSSEAYIARLVARGYKVAICDQLEDPTLAKGLVRRDVTRVVTPGAVTESSMLDESKNNYFACVYGEEEDYGLCFCDISTGAFHATAFQGATAEQSLCNELGAFSPAEILLGGEARFAEMLQKLLSERMHCCINREDESAFALPTCREVVAEQFDHSPEELGLGEYPMTVRAAGALLARLRDAQKSSLPHVNEMNFYTASKFMGLDLTARRNLELTETLRNKEKRGTLLWVMDKTKTAMGGRLLRSWMEQPLLDPTQIGKRHAAVEELVQNTVMREELMLSLREISDFERVISRVVTGTANCRDLVSLAEGASVLPDVKSRISAANSTFLQSLGAQIDPLEGLCTHIRSAIVDDPPFSIREGGMIREGFCDDIDHLREIQQNSKGMLAEIETREKEKTGIRNLRVGYNRVFGYYIEVAKGQVDLVPKDYIRRQTLSTGERYITQELKELETTILTSKDRVISMEYELFTKIRQNVSDSAEAIQRTAKAVAALDVLCSFAAVAVHNNYCRPEIDLSGNIDIVDGRHPVVEQMLKDSLFVPNDVHLSNRTTRCAIITGPNMAGKSTYMRQVALITIMAQMGSFVPAKSARIGIVDHVFTRIGASDDLASGQSTFMVEMNEVAEILKNATPDSLLILDEIGRGTSTYDGMAIAKAVLEHTADEKKLGAKTLFATHYHELCDIENQISGVKNYNIAVKKRQGDMIFLRKIVPGAADDSYGVEVAKLAGIPEKIITRARAILKELESGAPQPVIHAPVEQDDQISMGDIREAQLRDALEKITVETLTPIEALNTLYQLKKML